MNFSSLINQIAKRLPNKVALIENSYSITYAELWNKIEALTNSFLDIGLKKNDKVVIILPNCKEFIYVFFAILRANIIAVPLNSGLTPFELKKIFENCRPKALISNLSVINDILIKDKSLLQDKIIIVADIPIPNDHLDKSLKFSISLAQLYSPKRYRPIQKFGTSNNQIASINYTYRGYGYPLGAVLTHGNYVHGAVGYIRLINPSLDQKFLLMMPISHIFTLIGCIVVPLLRGATVVIMKNVIPSNIFRTIQHYKIDFLVGVPTIYKVLLKNYNSDKYNISSLKYGISGAAPMESDLYIEIKKKMGFQILQGYGLTETMPVICNPKVRIKSDSIGIPGHEVKVKIIDELGNERKIGEKGEILIGGPTVMKGYHNLKKETNIVLKNSWCLTGDIGWLDKDGYLYFEGLKKDIVKIGGNTVDLLEIKNLLTTHSEIYDAEVYAKQDDLWGSTIEAKVFVKQSGNLYEQDVRKYCSENLAVYKVPRKIRIIKLKDENRTHISTRSVD